MVVKDSGTIIASDGIEHSHTTLISEVGDYPIGGIHADQETYPIPLHSHRPAFCPDRSGRGTVHLSVPLFLTTGNRVYFGDFLNLAVRWFRDGELREGRWGGAEETFTLSRELRPSDPAIARGASPLPSAQFCAAGSGFRQLVFQCTYLGA